MASTQPIIRQISWLSIVPQVLVFALIVSVLFIFGSENSLLLGAVLYLLLSVILKRLIPKFHRKGMKYFKDKRYDLSIDEFNKSYEFFQKNKWIDKYRAIFLLSSSRISYSEMALINIAYCYGQIEEGTKSREAYEKALKEFPNSEIATSALKMVSSIKNIK